jgi:transcriptional regulator with XRE-family HTH domain
MNSKLEEKLQDSAYRTAFVASQINIGIPFQIKALMKTRGWTQEKLAERTGMLQPRISAILSPGKVRPNIETLRRIAEGFDCGLLVRFASFSELARWSDSFDPERFDVPAFESDAALKMPKEEGALADATVQFSNVQSGAATNGVGARGSRALPAPRKLRRKCEVISMPKRSESTGMKRYARGA